MVPALISPELHQILKKSTSISITARRNLILIGKVLQSISNEATFAEKEQYLTVIQNDACRTMCTLRKIIDQIGSGSVSTYETMYDQKKIFSIKVFSDKLFHIFENTVNQELLESILSKNTLYDSFCSEIELKNEYKELHSIIKNQGLMNIPVSENNVKLKWDAFVRRRSNYMKAKISVDIINDTLSHGGIGPTSHGGARHFSAPFVFDIASTSTNEEETSEISSIISDDIDNDEDDEYTNIISEEGKSKLIVKVNYRSRCANVSITKATSIVDVKRQVTKKLSIKTAFDLICVVNSKKIRLNNLEKWNNFLLKQGVEVQPGQFLYHLQVKTVK